VHSLLAISFFSTDTQHRHYCSFAFIQHPILTVSKYYDVSYQQLHRKAESTTTTALSENPRKNQITDGRSPLPIMPSQTFLDLAYSQFELLQNALIHSPMNDGNNLEEYESKVKSIALYLPQENSNTGQLEFLPSAVFPSHPKTERVFIASDASSGLPPTVPPTLTQLPGFANAQSIIPTYPFTSATTDTGGISAVVGTPEEVLCDRRLGSEAGSASSTALSIPLFSGARTIGVLLIWGQQKQRKGPVNEQVNSVVSSIWTDRDISQIRRAGETLAMALRMDADRHHNQIKTEEFRVAIADNLHQVKNPVQALRTFTKLLQRNMATDGDANIKLGQLVDNMVLQSERIAQNIGPIDTMIDAMEDPDSFNSYQRLLEPIETTNKYITQSENTRTVHPKLMPTNSYLIHLSSTSPEHVKPGVKTNRIIPTDDELQIAFVPDVLLPILSVSEALAMENDINFEVYGINDDTDLPGVMVYPKALQEAFSNVLDNAIKYVKLGKDGNWNEENTNPIVRVALLPNDKTMARGVTIIIEDNGPGISSQESKLIFQRGFRGEDAKKKCEGSGIGLDYSRSMIEKMGGELSIIANSKYYLCGAVVRFVLYRKIITN